MPLGQRPTRRETPASAAALEQPSHGTRFISQEITTQQGEGHHNDCVIINEILSRQPAAVSHVRQSLMDIGLWPQTAGSGSSSSSDPATCDSSGAAPDSSGSSGERRPTSTSSPQDAWPESDDLAKAQAKSQTHINDSNNDSSGGTWTTAGGNSSAGGVAGSFGGSSWDMRASSSNSRLEDGQGTDASASASAKGSQGTAGSASGGSGSSGFLAAWRRLPGRSGGSDASPKAKDGDSWDCSAKGKDSESSDDSGAPHVPDMPVHGLDCLPRDAVVWVEGEDTPIEICELTPGSHILCFDSLSRSVRYAEVLDVRQDEEPVQWVAVELADGTRTILTADHPVQLASNEAPQAVVKARDIEPQTSRIMVHRVTTEPVQVSSVVALPPGLVLPSGRVSVTVQQCDRNAILVASAEQGRADARFVAVGSADLAPQPLGVLGRFASGAGLLGGSPEAAEGRRAHSWPPSVARRWEPSRATGLVLQLPARRPGGSSSSGTVPDSQGSMQESASDTSSGGENTLVLLPWNLPGPSGLRAVAAAGAPDPGRVSALLQARNESWPSVGSAGHSMATCRPCSFAHRGRCSAGVWCPRCHSPHTKTNGRLVPGERRVRGGNPGHADGMPQRG